jgi:hypothetical protein
VSASTPAREIRFLASKSAGEVGGLVMLRGAAACSSSRTARGRACGTPWRPSPRPHGAQRGHFHTSSRTWRRRPGGPTEADPLKTVRAASPPPRCGSGAASSRGNRWAGAGLDSRPEEPLAGVRDRLRRLPRPAEPSRARGSSGARRGPVLFLRDARARGPGPPATDRGIARRARDAYVIGGADHPSTSSSARAAPTRTSSGSLPAPCRAGTLILTRVPALPGRGGRRLRGRRARLLGAARRLAGAGRGGWSASPARACAGGTRRVAAAVAGLLSIAYGFYEPTGRP